MPLQASLYEKLLQYADDTTLICNGTSNGEVYQCLPEDLWSLFMEHIQLIETK